MSCVDDSAAAAAAADDVQYARTTSVFLRATILLTYAFPLATHIYLLKIRRISFATAVTHVITSAVILLLFQ